ncbi:hypothetical protein ACJX0J_008657 [Zea mays]
MYHWDNSIYCTAIQHTRLCMYIWQVRQKDDIDLIGLLNAKRIIFSYNYFKFNQFCNVKKNNNIYDIKLFHNSHFFDMLDDNSLLYKFSQTAVAISNILIHSLSYYTLQTLKEANDTLIDGFLFSYLRLNCLGGEAKAMFTKTKALLTKYVFRYIIYLYITKIKRKILNNINIFETYNLERLIDGQHAQCSINNGSPESNHDTPFIFLFNRQIRKLIFCLYFIGHMLIGFGADSTHGLFNLYNKLLEQEIQ